MTTSPKQRLLTDIQESIDLYEEQLKTNSEFKADIEERISAYLAAEKTLSQSSEYQHLREFIQKRVSKWQNHVSEDEAEILKSQEALQWFLDARANVEKRKEDLGL